MISKTAIVEQEILKNIRQGSYAVGEKIPSRHSLCKKFQCSRTTIERAIANLTQAGLLSGTRGSGTRVVSAGEHTQKISRLFAIVAPNVSFNGIPFSDVIISRNTTDLPVQLVHPAQAAKILEKQGGSGYAVIWIQPGEEQILLMDYLRSKKVPQILLNRDYRDYDCIYTDPLSSIREGITWLTENAGKDIAFVARRPATERPYLYNRTLAFYEIAQDFNLRLDADSRFVGSFSDVPREINACGEQLWGQGRQRKKGIFVMEKDLVMPLIMTAYRYDCVPGRDYFLLCFDRISELRTQHGIAMMSQPYDRFGTELARWLSLVADGRKTKERFAVPLKTDLITG